MADKNSTAGEKNSPLSTADGKGRGLGTPAWVAICVVVLVVGVLCGHPLLGGAGSGASAGVALSGKTTLSEQELDSTIATYTYNGQTTGITAREVIEQNWSGVEEPPANEDGTYNVPTANDVVTYAQNAVVLADAAAQGITVADDEVSAFAEQMFGTSDYATIASNCGIDEEIAKATIADSATMSKLRDSVVSTPLPDAPTAPTEPEEGAEDTPTAATMRATSSRRSSATSGTPRRAPRARQDGDYYATLSSYEITNDSAAYAAAEAAYQVASNNYSEVATQVSEEWVAYTRNLLSNATVQVGSLVAS